MKKKDKKAKGKRQKAEGQAAEQAKKMGAI